MTLFKHNRVSSYALTTATKRNLIVMETEYLTYGPYGILSLKITNV
jgi:hypothetical protein